MRTPEGKIKDQVKALLKDKHIASTVAPVLEPRGYYNMPVPTGYGAPMLDFIGWFFGRAFAIETKRMGKELTARQKLTATAMSDGGGVVFRIYDTASLNSFAGWLDIIEEAVYGK